jgi:hypothetical protein
MALIAVQISVTGGPYIRATGFFEYISSPLLFEGIRRIRCFLHAARAIQVRGSVQGNQTLSQTPPHHKFLHGSVCTPSFWILGLFRKTARSRSIVDATENIDICLEAEWSLEWSIFTIPFDAFFKSQTLWTACVTIKFNGNTFSNQLRSSPEVYKPSMTADKGALLTLCRCFCHKKTIDLGFVCSVCLSIFCQFSRECSTCG